jgi:hypothetical protein
MGRRGKLQATAADIEQVRGNRSAEDVSFVLALGGAGANLVARAG